jgi:hypothetical protein
MELPKDMHDMFQKIAEHHNAHFRLCKTLVAGFKATNEQDLVDGRYDGRIRRFENHHGGLSR